MKKSENKKSGNREGDDCTQARQFSDTIGMQRILSLMRCVRSMRLIFFLYLQSLLLLLLLLPCGCRLHAHPCICVPMVLSVRQKAHYACVFDKHRFNQSEPDKWFILFSNCDTGTINISYYLIRIPVRASTIYSHSGARSYRTETRQLRQRLHGICDNVVVHRRLHFIIIACCCRCMLPLYVCMYFILNKYMYIFECMCAYYIYVVMNASVLSMMFASSFILSFFIVYVLIVVGRKALRELLACIPYVTPRACISLCLCECDHIHQWSSFLA